MRRAWLCLFLLAVTAGGLLASGCGFGLSDDSAQPNPGLYWGWVCANGDPPDGDAGCPSVDGGDASADAGTSAGDGD
jgi:hypothetical protein